MEYAMRYWTLFFIILVSGCASKYRINQDTSLTPLKDNEGYLSFVIDSLDPLYDLQLLNVESGEYFYVGAAPKGLTNITLKVTEAEYCFVGFDVYNWRVDYTDKGFCTYVEAGELNYFSEFIVRDPVTTSRPNFSQFVRLLKNEHPELCKEFISEDCNL